LRSTTWFEEVRMATRDSGGQSQSGRARRDAEIDDAAPPEVDPEVAERVEKVSEEVDDLLDEIDSVLEENAEEFVRGYVQKGGE
jgi:ubiquitin-like protein Pup